MRIFINEFCGHPFQLELSRELARMGHSVLHVYFADNDSTPKGQTQLRKDDPDGLAIEGLHITRQFSKHSLLQRRQADIEYGHVAAERVVRFRPDVVMSANMPLDAQAILLRATHDDDARFIFWLQDVYSVAVRFVLKKRARLLSWAVGAHYELLEKKLLHESDAIVCIAPGFAEFLQDWGISGPKVHVIENWAPLDEVRPLPRNNAWAMEHGAASDFCFVYSGTLGMKHKPELLLELARYLEANKSGKLIVVAGGAGANWLAKNANGINPSFLKLLPFQPYERVAEVFGSADVLITLLDSEAGSFAVPSKALSYLCSARALIIAAPSTNEAARVVQRAKAGIVVSPDDPSELLAAAKQLLMDKAFCEECGRNARAYAERSFVINVIANRFLSILAPDSEAIGGSEVDNEAIKTPFEHSGAI